MKSIGKTAFCLALVLCITGCAAILQSPGAEKTGRVAFTISGGARTALPSIEQFEKITLSFAAKNGSPALEDRDATSGSVTVELPLGSWDVSVNAYSGATDPSPAATAQKTIGYDGTDIYDGEDQAETIIRFVLEPVGTGTGTLRYSVVVPEDITLAGSGSYIAIEQNGELFADLDSDGFSDGAYLISGSEAEKSISLDAGRYVARIVLVDNANNTAVYLESVVILPGLVTELAFAPAAADFLSPAERAALPDLESISFAGTAFNTGLTVGSLEVNGQSHALAIEAENGTETLYFTLAKPEAYRASLGAGAEGKAVFATFDGGPEASDTLVVIKVDASTVAAEGGSVVFTLTVAEEGKTGVDILVTATVAAPGGPGLYIATEVASEEVLTKVKDNSIVDLKTALIWLAANAADDTDYVVLIGEDSELTDAYRYDSKEGSSGVTITLRGIDQERKIYGDAILSGSTVPVFNIKPGTTLALGDKVTFDGNSESRDTNHPPVVRLQGGSFEMLPGSKITNVYGSTVISINPTTAEGARIILRGGTITDNIVSASLVAGASNGTAHPLRVEMYDDAVITKNRMQNTSANNISATNKHPYIFGHIAAVSLPSGGTFIMRGGEISYNSPRGVYIGEYTPVTNTPGREGVFEMKGGTISHNGNDAIQFKDSTAYSLAAGVYMATVAGSFSMTGGAISDNGSEHTTLPYSGIYLTSRRLTPSGNTNNNVLDGTVAIKNNKVSIVGVSADEPVTIYLGNNFIADSIEVVLTIGNATYTNLVNYWNGKRLLASLPEDGLTIDSAVVSKFVLSGHYYLSSSNVNKQCEQISGYTSRISTTAEEGISGAGYVVVTKNDD